MVVGGGGGQRRARGEGGGGIGSSSRRLVGYPMPHTRPVLRGVTGLSEPTFPRSQRLVFQTNLERLSDSVSC